MSAATWSFWWRLVECSSGQRAFALSFQSLSPRTQDGIQQHVLGLLALETMAEPSVLLLGKMASAASYRADAETLGDDDAHSDDAPASDRSARCPLRYRHDYCRHRGGPRRRARVPVVRRGGKAARLARLRLAGDRLGPRRRCPAAALLGCGSRRRLSPVPRGLACELGRPGSRLTYLPPRVAAGGASCREWASP